MKERKKRTLLVRFKNARLQTKITLLLFLLLFLPSILFAIYSAARVRNTLQEQNLAAAESPLMKRFRLSMYDWNVPPA